ncbi:MAG: cytochrome c oxidase assembly protein [Pseudomonadota bacterium]|nr:cytochrome c oxidase assembly protein [Pseudomonadota bacterium]
MPNLAQWLALLAGALYLAGVWRTRRAGKPWSSWRSASFAAGIVTLFLAIAAHATLGKLMYAWLLPQGTGASAGELQAAAQWMYYGGDLAEIVLLVALMQQWLRGRRRGPSVELGSLRGA